MPHSACSTYPYQTSSLFSLTVPSTLESATPILGGRCCSRKALSQIARAHSLSAGRRLHWRIRSASTILLTQSYQSLTPADSVNGQPQVQGVPLFGTKAMRMCPLVIRDEIETRSARTCSHPLDSSSVLGSALLLFLESCVQWKGLNPIKALWDFAME
jgi:hypothetical protein